MAGGLIDLKFVTGPDMDDHECGDLTIPVGHCNGIFLQVSPSIDDNGEPGGEGIKMDVIISVLSKESAVELLEVLLKIIKANIAGTVPEDTVDVSDLYKE